MVYPESYMTMLVKFNTVSDDNIISIHTPADVMANEARTLYFWAYDDLDVLLANGLKEQYLNELLPASDALLTAESIWRNEIESGGEFSNEWKAKSPEAFELRSILLHTYKYAFRNDPDLLKLLAELQKGSSNTDLIEDLHGLNLLGLKYADKLQAINADKALVVRSGELAIVMGDLLAKVNSQRIGSNDSKTIRDKAYTYVNNLLNEVRECGRYVFWKDEKRLKGYRSNYNRKKYIRRKNSFVEEVQE